MPRTVARFSAVHPATAASPRTPAAPLDVHGVRSLRLESPVPLHTTQEVRP